MNIQEMIELALKDFDIYLKESNWYGRENEVVNLFAHKFLNKYIGNKPFLSLDQLGIEVAVKQLKTERSNELVRKDLIIWKEGETSVWNEKGEIVNDPLAIIEWKTNNSSKCEYDMNWLRGYKKKYPEVIGYSVCAFIKENRGIQYTKIV